MPPATTRFEVALLIETSNQYSRQLLLGIGQYAHVHDQWSLWVPELRRGELPPAWLAMWRGDGLIARLETPEIAKAVADRGLPVVDVSAAQALPTAPVVETDDLAIAQMAFEHLTGRGFRRLGFVGEPAFQWSNLRQHAFVELSHKHKIPVTVYPSPQSPSADEPHAGLERWLRDLPRPIGLFVCFDQMAKRVLDVCRLLDVAVPEEMAVLGVDNDPVLCELSTPSLSSIEPDARRTGYLAAELLDRMLHGEVLAPERKVLPPLGVAQRRSTEILSVDDPHISLALRFIREFARTGIDVGDVVARTSLSRRSLEARFRSLLNRSPHEEIERVRLEQVKRLLTETDLSIGAIAERAGYRHAEYMTVVFRRTVGQTPTEYRRGNEQGHRFSQ